MRTKPVAVVADSELREVLSDALSSEIGSITRRTCPYQSSFRLETVDVSLPSGIVLPLIFKDLGSGVLPEARALKPEFVRNPEREIRTYQEVLARVRMGTATCHAAVAEEETGRYWLFLERVPGTELYQVGDLSTWCAAARWLAVFHERFAESAERIARRVPVLKQTAQTGRAWMLRARRLFAEAEPDVQRDVERLERLYEEAAPGIDAMDVTVLHGEFYPSNVLIDPGTAGPRVCPIDWETTSVGPAALDVAALTAGSWSEKERRVLVEAYVDARANLDSPTSIRRFTTEFERCRLHVAVQWLGWFGPRKAYRQHRHDWLGEALRLAEAIAAETISP